MRRPPRSAEEGEETMKWFKRPHRRQPEHDTAGDTRAQAARIEVGMTTREVIRLLGKPSAKMTEREFLSGFQTVSWLGSGRILDQESWLYYGHPYNGMVTMVTFIGGRVTEMVSRRQ